MRCDVPALLRHKGLKCCGVHPIAISGVYSMYTKHICIYIIYIYTLLIIHTHCVYVYTFRMQTVHELFHDATDMASPDA